MRSLSLSFSTSSTPSTARLTLTTVCRVYAAIKRSNARAGQWLVIPGAGGGVGSMAVQYARYAGIRVLAIDAGDKGELCKSLGAEEFIDFTTCSECVQLSPSLLEEAR